MDSPDEHVSTIVELGLSPSQARVYLVLVESKNLTAQTIHTISGVARLDVYRVLGELEEAELVEEGFEYVTDFEGAKIFKKRKL
jgi:sugar-specific transcriptional regulator TrmB